MADRFLDVSDPLALRALAHPLRVRLLRLVREHRPVTNAELAALVGESTANVSYHLSVLARHGFVEPDPTPGATRRHKPWRTTYDRMRMHSAGVGTTPLESPGGGALAALLADDRATQDAYLAAPSAPEGTAQDAAVFQISRLVLDAARAEELATEVSTLLDRYRRDAGPDPDEALFAVSFVAVPVVEEVHR
ncbi:MAG: winged helix-turn-helix domain-containing protein [Sporichthyaceae bacterium]